MGELSRAGLVSALSLALAGGLTEASDREGTLGKFLNPIPELVNLPIRNTSELYFDAGKRKALVGLIPDDIDSGSILEARALVPDKVAREFLTGKDGKKHDLYIVDLDLTSIKDRWIFQRVPYRPEAIHEIGLRGRAQIESYGDRLASMVVERANDGVVQVDEKLADVVRLLWDYVPHDKISRNWSRFSVFSRRDEAITSADITFRELNGIDIVLRTNNYPFRREGFLAPEDVQRAVHATDTINSILRERVLGTVGVEDADFLRLFDEGHAGNDSNVPYVDVLKGMVFEENEGALLRNRDELVNALSSAQEAGIRYVESSGELRHILDNPENTGVDVFLTQPFPINGSLVDGIRMGKGFQGRNGEVRVYIVNNAPRILGGFPSHMGPADSLRGYLNTRAVSSPQTLAIFRDKGNMVWGSSILTEVCIGDYLGDNRSKEFNTSQ